MSEQKDPYAFHFIGLVYGESPESIADQLEMYADRIRRGDAPTSPGAFLRKADSGGGEEAFACRMHGVYRAEEYEPKPVAMFGDPETARRFAAREPLFDEEDDGPGGDLCVMRSDVVLSAWNHLDQEADPHAKEAP